MALAAQLYGEALNRPKEGVAFAERAYAAAPTDREVVHAYIKTHVLAGVWFDDKDIARERPKALRKEYAFLASKPRFDDASRKFPRAKLEADLSYVEHVQAGCFAYLEVKTGGLSGCAGYDPPRLEDETSVNAFRDFPDETPQPVLRRARSRGARQIPVPAQRLRTFVAGSSDKRVFLANPAARVSSTKSILTSPPSTANPSRSGWRPPATLW
jgi:hypothetical protein